MRTPKPRSSAVVCALMGAGVAVLIASGYAQAQVAQISSDNPAGVVVFPKVLVDLTGHFTGGKAVDTIIQLTNTDTFGRDPNRSLHCFWVNSRSRCSNTQTACDPNSDDPTLNCRAVRGLCQPTWTFNNFYTDLTPGQTIGFRASQGLLTLPCTNAACFRGRHNGENVNTTPGVLPVPNLFIGELKCVEVDNIDAVRPVNRNDIEGVARIYTVTSGAGTQTVDVREYNAIGIQATTATNDGNTTLCLGTEGAECTTAEYAACPDTLIMNHFFENATPFAGSTDTVSTMLTLVPCTENFSTAGQTATVAQFVTFNEFEQRFSSSRRIECFDTVRLADIDTRVGTSDDDASLFAVGVQGTLGGQTRIHGVPANQPFHGLLALGEEFYSSGFSDAFNVHYDKNPRANGSGDVIRLPAFP